MRSAHALARMIDRDAVASGSYFVVGSIVIGLKVISNNPLDNLPTKCPLQSSKAYKQVGSITLSEWLEMYYVLLYTEDIVQDMQLEINRICIYIYLYIFSWLLNKWRLMQIINKIRQFLQAR